MKLLRPTIVTEYTNIYKPKGCIYKDSNSSLFMENNYYEDWIVNDHTFIKGDDGWHIYGITHPRPHDFIDDYNYNTDTVHHSEFCLFHAFGEGAFKNSLKNDSYIDEDKILYPLDRPDDDILSNFAPHAIKYNDIYHLIFSPSKIRYATSTDLYNFNYKGVLFDGHHSTRDPNIFIDDDNTIYMFYAVENKVCYRKSVDMLIWSDEFLLQTNPYKNGTSESPFMIKKNGIYYLFWCLWDDTCGSYDNRTFVFACDSLDDFEGLSPLTILNAHAPEIIQDEEGDFYISSAYYPSNGINVAKLDWI